MALSRSWVSFTQAGNTEYSGERVGTRPSAVSCQVSEQTSKDACELLNVQGFASVSSYLLKFTLMELDKDALCKEMPSKARSRSRLDSNQLWENVRISSPVSFLF